MQNRLKIRFLQILHSKLCSEWSFSLFSWCPGLFSWHSVLFSWLRRIAKQAQICILLVPSPILLAPQSKPSLKCTFSLFSWLFSWLFSQENRYSCGQQKSFYSPGYSPRRILLGFTEAENTPIFEQSLMTITPETLSGIWQKTDSDKLGHKCFDEEAWNPTLYSISTSRVLKANWALWVRKTRGRCFDQEQVRRH